MSKVIMEDLTVEVIDPLPDADVVNPLELDRFLEEGDYGIARFCIACNRGTLYITSAKGTCFDWHADSKLFRHNVNAKWSPQISYILNPYLTTVLGRLEDLLAVCSTQQEIKMIQTRIKLMRKVKEKIGTVASMTKIFKIMALIHHDETMESRMNTSDPESLPLKGGKLICLKTGVVRDRVHTDLWTEDCPVRYLGEEHECLHAKTFFNQLFLERIDLIEHAQELFGYFMTGRTTEESFHFLWGDEHDGKRFLMEMMRRILGKFYSTCDYSLLLKNSKPTKKGHDPVKNMVTYVRLCGTLETNSDYPLTQRNMDLLTNDDSVFVRYALNNANNSVKLVMSVAEPPPVHNRIDVIRFPAVFPPNGSPFQNVLEFHIDEVFTLLVHGVRRWYANGCHFSHQEMGAVELAKYHDDRDPVGKFIADFCEIGENFSVRASELQLELNSNLRGERLTAGALAIRMERRGFQLRQNGSNIYLGIRLKRFL